MTDLPLKRSFSSDVKPRLSPLAALGWLVGLMFFVLVAGCKDPPAAQKKTSSAAQANRHQRGVSQALLKTISGTLSDLASQVDTQLRPAQVILDASKSANRKEVRATCKVNPKVPNGPHVFLEVPAGNANFRGLGIKAGDLVRYFVIYDQESLKKGFEERTYLELVVRRLDSQNPNNALILERGLSGPMPAPEKIEIWRYSDKRMIDIHTRLQRYIKLRKPAIGWEPSPDENGLTLLMDRLNQWLRNQTEAVDTWQYATLLEQLPQELREAEPMVERLSAEALRERPFEESEGRLLQQAVWIRDISAWAKGTALSDLEVASALFDWTVRNIQLEPTEAGELLHHPWQALMFGMGTAEHRAWVFAELCRQQQLDVVMLAVGSSAEESQRWWLPALLNEGKLYLFDTRLGLPIPGPDDAKVATLADVVADPGLLRNLDLSEKEAYEFGAEDLKHVEAWLVATPEQLSRRWALLESVLEGDNYMVLASGHQRVAEELAKHAQLSGTRFWPLPFRSILQQLKLKPPSRLWLAKRFEIFAQRPRLWKARVLHFQGAKQIPASQRDDPLAEPRRGHRDATRLYLNKRIRPSEKVLAFLQPAKQEVYRTAKLSASYWLGLLRYDQDSYAVAVDWLLHRTLEASPTGPWSAGARYNLARAYEAQGELEKAIELLKEDTSPQHHGNHLRARMLQQQTN